MSNKIKLQPLKINGWNVKENLVRLFCNILNKPSSCVINISIDKIENDDFDFDVKIDYSSKKHFLTYDMRLNWNSTYGTTLYIKKTVELNLKKGSKYFSIKTKYIERNLNDAV